MTPDQQIERLIDNFTIHLNIWSRLSWTSLFLGMLSWGFLYESSVIHPSWIWLAAIAYGITVVLAIVFGLIGSVFYRNIEYLKWFAASRHK